MRKVKFGAQLDTVVSQPESGSVTAEPVVSPGTSTPVVSQDKVVSPSTPRVVSPTKQQRWAAAHLEQRRAIHRDGQRRRRA